MSRKSHREAEQAKGVDRQNCRRFALLAALSATHRQRSAGC